MDNDLFRLLLIRGILLLQLLFSVDDATAKFIGTLDATVVGMVVIGNENAL